MKNTKTSLFVLLFSFISVFANAQKPDTLWTKTMGGSLNDCGGYVTGTKPKAARNIQGDIFIGGTTESSDGYFHQNKGIYDCFVIKLTQNGDTLWSKTYGGEKADYLTDIIALSDGGALFCGYTFSTVSDFGAHHGLSDEDDGFIVRIDGNGNIVWGRQYGGFSFAGLSGSEKLTRLIDLGTDNYIALGQTNSNNGDLTIDFTKFNCGWLLKINGSGNIIQSKKIAHSDHSEFNSNIFYDGALLTDSDAIITHGETQYFSSGWKIWTIKTDTNGNVLWQKNLGCNIDNQAGAITSTGNNHVVFTSGVYGASGDVTLPAHWGTDFWVVDLDSSGTIVRQQIIGGNGYDTPSSIVSDDNNNIFVSGFSGSHEFDPGPDSLGTDFFIAKLNPLLDTLWTLKVGGSGTDINTGIITNSGTEFYTIGKTDSQDGYVNGTFGLKDIWLAKFTEADNYISEINRKKLFSVYPNPCSDYFEIILPQKNSTPSELNILNVYGTLVLSYDLTESTIKSVKIDSRKLINGIYYINLTTDNNSSVEKIIIMNNQ